MSYFVEKNSALYRVTYLKGGKRRWEKVRDLVPDTPARTDIAERIEAYLADCRRRGLKTKTLEGYRSTLGLFADCFFDQPTRDLERFLRKYDDPTTRASYQRTLRPFLRQAYGYDPGNPTRAKRRLPKGVNPLQFKAIMSALEPKYQPAAAFAYETGLRLGEVCRLRWDDVRSRQIVLWDQKNGDEEVLPLSRYAAAILEARPGNAARPFPHRPGTLSHAFTRAARRAKIDRSFHGLRHGFATRLVENGATPYEVMEALRHKQIVTTQIYTRMSRKRLQERLDELTA